MQMLKKVFKWLGFAACVVLVQYVLAAVVWVSVMLLLTLLAEGMTLSEFVEAVKELRCINLADLVVVGRWMVGGCVFASAAFLLSWRLSRRVRWLLALEAQALIGLFWFVVCAARIPSW